ncbi:HipA domain-containing protein [bacterium]|nr:HipA domain-containing protein [bacterium]
MNRCPVCGKPLNTDQAMHKSCINRLFGVSYIPGIDLALSEITIKAQEMAGKLSISGVQPKLSMKLNKRSKKLMSVTEGGEYILKPQSRVYDQIPENENLCMTIAELLGIDIPSHALMKLKDDSYAYIVKRFDRENNRKINQEDFCQILGKSKKDKYTGSVEQIANKLNEISEIPALDIQYLFERVLFSFIIGNGDAHLKNYSVIYTDMNNIRLSPAYDIVSSKLVIPREEDLALALNGKKNNIQLTDFAAFSDKFSIPEKVMNNMTAKKQLIIDQIDDSQLNPEYKEKLIQIVTERFQRL